MLLADERGVLAIFGVADTVKDSSHQAISKLNRLGVRTLLLSGDNPHTADVIARQVGIDDVCGNLSPEEKLRVVDALLSDGGGKLGMVGTASTTLRHSLARTSVSRWMRPAPIPP